MKNSLLEFVTLTGADDTVNPEELLKISEKYPFVEWGILIGSNQGHHRFPSFEWISNLCSCVNYNPNINLSLHICGKQLNNIINGNFIDIPLAYLDMFGRCQLNFHGEKQKYNVTSQILKAFNRGPYWRPEIIIQLDGLNNWILNAELMEHYRCSGLFDTSHGAGILPNEWPYAILNLKLGWAGGLGPDNIEEEFPKIYKRALGNFWIDMETKLYTNKKFDLNKCIDILEKVEKLNGK